MQAVKFVHLSHALSGGAGIACHHIHQALGEQGIDSRILHAAGQERDDPRIGKVHATPLSPWKAQAVKLHLLPYPLFDMRREFNRSLRLGKITARQFEIASFPFSDFRPEDHPWLRDAIPVLHWTSGFVDWPRFFGKIKSPVVFVLHDEQPYQGLFHYRGDTLRNPVLTSLDTRVKAIKQRAISRHRCHVFGVSEWITQSAKDAGFFPGDSSFATLGLPIDHECWNPVPKPLAKRALEIPEDHFVIGFGSHMLENRRKGFSDLVSVLNGGGVGEFSKHVTLLTFGIQKKTMPPVDPYHLHLGPLESQKLLSLAYSAMDVVVVPSLEENLGMVSIEAQMCGTRVIVSRAGGVPETIFSKGNGRLYEPGDCAGLREALRASHQAFIRGESGPALLPRPPAGWRDHALTASCFRRVWDEHLEQKG